MGDVERGEIVADHRHHRLDGALAHERQPFRLGLAHQARAKFAREIFADGLQIVAGIEALGDRADVLAERLAVAQEGRARQHVDLAAGVVDVIFARRLAAGEDKQACERVAEHRAARMADMHRPGRIGAHIFDIDRPFPARRPGPETRSLDENVGEDIQVNLWLEHDIDEAGACDLGALHIRLKPEIGDKPFGERARVRARLLGFPRVDHRRVGREVAVGRVARRLDDEAAKIEVRRQFARGDPLFDETGDARLELGEDVHDSYRAERSQCLRLAIQRHGRLAARLYRKSGAPVKKPGVLGDGETVGHAGDIVGDRARQIAVLRPGRPFGRHQGRLGEIGLEQAPHDRIRPIADLAHLGMAVHAGEEKGLDVAVRRLDRGRMPDQGAAGARDRLRARDLRFGDPPAALADRVLDEPGDDAAGQLVDDARLLEAGMEAVDLPHEIADKRNGGADLGERKQAGAQAVVDVVRVIGDIVSDRRGLRLEARMEAEVERLRLVVSEDGRRDAAAPGSARSGRRLLQARARCA